VRCLERKKTIHSLQQEQRAMKENIYIRLQLRAIIIFYLFLLGCIYIACVYLGKAGVNLILAKDRAYMLNCQNKVRNVMMARIFNEFPVHVKLIGHPTEFIIKVHKIVLHHQFNDMN